MPYSFNTLFIETNSSSLIFESIEALEIKTSILFNLNFANNSILLCFYLFFLIFDSYFLIPTAIAQVFNSIAELVIPIGTPIKESKAEIGIHLVIAEAKIRKSGYKLGLHKLSCVFYSSIQFALFLQENNFFFHLYFLI